MEINENIKFDKYRIYSLSLSTNDEEIEEINDEEIKQKYEKLNLKMRIYPNDNKIVLFPKINYQHKYELYGFTRKINLELELHFIANSNIIKNINEENAENIANQLLDRSYFLIKNCLSSLISMDGMNISDFRLELNNKNE